MKSQRRRLQQLHPAEENRVSLAFQRLTSVVEPDLARRRLAADQASILHMITMAGRFMVVLPAVADMMLVAITPDTAVEEQLPALAILFSFTEYTVAL